jgi:hypothetical protein
MRGNVIPFNGNRPTIAPMLIIVWMLIQAKTPITKSLENESLVLFIILCILENNMA